MKTIKYSNNETYTISKSTFITYLFKVFNEEEVSEYLTKIKSENSDAKHICYAYIIDNTKRFNDDGEPKNTAGIPLLSVLEKNHLNYILAITARYMNGPKLGASNLLRSYVFSIKKALKSNTIIDITKGKRIKITFSYEKEKFMENLFKNAIIIKKEYQDTITYIVDIQNSILNVLDSNSINYDIISEIIF